MAFVAARYKIHKHELCTRSARIRSRLWVWPIWLSECAYVNAPLTLAVCVRSLSSSREAFLWEFQQFLAFLAVMSVTVHFVIATDSAYSVDLKRQFISEAKTTHSAWSSTYLWWTKRHIALVWALQICPKFKEMACTALYINWPGITHLGTLRLVFSIKMKVSSSPSQ